MKTVHANWDSALLICRKCSKRQRGGFGRKGRTPLAKALKRLVGKGRKAGIGVVEVKCLGICPRHAVTLIDSRDMSTWRLVRPGSDVAALLASLTPVIDLPAETTSKVAGALLGEAA